jgi:hypothetical protein
MSITPALRIEETSNGNSVLGSVDQIDVSQSEFDDFSQHLQKFEEWGLNNSDSAITDTFAFILQPLSPELPCTLLHLSPETQGKATDRIVKLLDIIKDLLGQQNVTISYYAFDGDSAYSKLVDRFVASVDTIALSNEFNGWSKLQHPTACVVDPLHVLKRFRYRLLNSHVRNGFDITSPVANLSEYKGRLNVPSIVFSNQGFTKMNDDLPLRLFTLSNLFVLHDAGDLAMLAYSLMPTLLILAFHGISASIADRRYLLEIIYYYTAFYEKVKTSARNPLPERKSAEKFDVTLFSNSLLQDVRSAVIAALIEMGQHDGRTVYLHRIESNPVEHFFGRCRMLSRNCHRWQKLLKVVKNDLLLSQIRAEYGTGARVDGKRTTFGIPIVMADGEGELHFSKPPREVAASLLIVFGYEISSKIFPTSRSFTITNLRNHAPAATDDFFMQLAEFGEREFDGTPAGRRRLSTILLETGENSAIRARQRKKILQ